MSAFEKVTRFNLLKLFCVKVVVISTIKVMNSGHTLIIYDELLVLMLLLLLKHIILLESFRAIRLVLVHPKILVAHLLNMLIQALKLFRTYVLFEIGLVHKFVRFMQKAIL